MALRFGGGKEEEATIAITKADKRTPIPWQIKGGGVSIWIIGDLGQRWETVVCGLSALLPDRPQANAEFIVRACNAHDELVEALTMLDRETEVDHYHAGHDKCARCKVDAAIALATGDAA